MENEMWQTKTFKWAVQSINFHLPSWLLKKLRFCFWNFFTISLPDGFFICFVVGVQSLSCVRLFGAPWKARHPCPPPSPRVCSNSRPLSYPKKFPKVPVPITVKITGHRWTLGPWAHSGHMKSFPGFPYLISLHSLDAQKLYKQIKFQGCCQRKIILDKATAIFSNACTIFDSIPEKPPDPSRLKMPTGKADTVSLVLKSVPWMVRHFLLIYHHSSDF